ncbi:MAG: glycosyltransferase family 4 protein [Patescibacteria group bacterium]|jgi:phosphatidylinositol alpha-mannosyltransferase
MKIGILSQTYYPIKGGIAEHVHATATELRKRGHEATIITANFNRGDEEWSDGVERIGRDLTLPFNGAFVNITIGARLAADFRRLEKKYNFDVLHIHNPPDPVLPIVATLNAKAPIVGTFHTYKPSSLAYKIMQRPLDHRVIQKLRVRIAVSEAAKSFFSKYFTGPWEILPNGVNIERFHPSNAPMPHLAGGPPTILFVGRMDPRKGVNIMLDAFTRLAKDAPDARLVVVGGGILIHHYKRYVPLDLRPRVQFMNYVSWQDLPRYYASADICCFPAYGRESFGIVLAEAMAAGKPMVASDIVGYRAVIDDGKNGLLAKTADAADFARKLKILLDDKDLRRNMGEHGRHKAETHYAWPAIVDKLEGYYRQAISAHREG